jgi:hypothetical protein
VPGSSDHGNEPSIFVKGVKFLDNLNDNLPLRKCCTVEVDEILHMLLPKNGVLTMYFSWVRIGDVH